VHPFPALVSHPKKYKGRKGGGGKKDFDDAISSFQFLLMEGIEKGGELEFFFSDRWMGTRGGGREKKGGEVPSPYFCTLKEFERKKRGRLDIAIYSFFVPGSCEGGETGRKSVSMGT